MMQKYTTYLPYICMAFTEHGGDTSWFVETGMWDFMGWWGGGEGEGGGVEEWSGVSGRMGMKC